MDASAYVKPSRYIPMQAVNVSCDYYNLKYQMTLNGTSIPTGEGSQRPAKGCLGSVGNRLGSYLGGEEMPF